MKANSSMKLRHVLLALSTANLCFLRSWIELLYPAAIQYHAQERLGPFPYIAIFLNVLLWAIVFFTFAELVFKSSKRFIKRTHSLCYLFVGILVINSIRLNILAIDSISVLKPLAQNPLTSLLGLILLALIYKKWWFHRTSQIFSGLLIILSPFIIFTFSVSIWRLHKEKTYFNPTPFANRIPNTETKPRVVWIIFDELDERLTFVKRPDDIKMPFFDDFRSHSILASNAFSPADVTEHSIPALLTGRLVASATPIGASRLSIKFQDTHNNTIFKQLETVFNTAHDAGLNTAVVGWYHPYCRSFYKALTDCAWYAPNPPAPKTILGQMILQNEQVLDSFPGVERTRYRIFTKYGIPIIGSDHYDKIRRHRIFIHEQILQKAKQLVSDPGLNLIFIHASIPHPPGIFDRKSKRFSYDKDSSYIDNLELTDQALGELKKTMIQAHLWDKTTVIISADHSFRLNKWRSKYYVSDPATRNGTLDDRVPFLIKLPGKNIGISFEPAIDTIVTRNLVLDVLQKKVKTQRDLQRWLTQNSRHTG